MSDYATAARAAAPGFTFVETPSGVTLSAAFDGGRLTSDGGLPWLAVAEAEMGI